MYHFHVNLFADPKEASLACTWEDAATVLESMPRMIFEPDGSFVVSGEASRGVPSEPGRPRPRSSSTRWQVDGHLFDFAGKLHRLELHGECPPEFFDALLRSVGWPKQPISFELVREGTTIDEPEFRLRASS